MILTKKYPFPTCSIHRLIFLMEAQYVLCEVKNKQIQCRLIVVLEGISRYILNTLSYQRNTTRFPMDIQFSKYLTIATATTCSSTNLYHKTLHQLNLTLRLLMSYIYIYTYIYIYIYIYIYMEHLFLMFLDHTQRRSTVGRTPLDE